MATTGANKFVLNIIELQNVITSAGNVSGSASLSNAVAQLQEMVLYDTKQIKTNTLSAFDSPPIQTDSLNMSNATINGSLIIPSAGTPGIGKYLTCVDTLGTAEWLVPAVPSDQTYKTNIQGISNADAILSGLYGTRFAWKATGVQDIGVIAQDVEKVLPEAFIPARDRRPAMVEYHKIIPVLIELVKAQGLRIAALEEAIKPLGAPARSAAAASSYRASATEVHP